MKLAESSEVADASIGGSGGSAEAGGVEGPRPGGARGPQPKGGGSAKNSVVICAPAIIRAASLMPVRTLEFGALNPEGELYRGCFYRSLESDLRAGRARHERA